MPTHVLFPLLFWSHESNLENKNLFLCEPLTTIINTGGLRRAPEARALKQV